MNGLIIKQAAKTVGERLKHGARMTYERAKGMHITEWGALASVMSIGIWMFDRAHPLRGKKKS